jgi:hypothetical protein
MREPSSDGKIVLIESSSDIEMMLGLKTIRMLDSISYSPMSKQLPQLSLLAYLALM